ncbi:MAG: hypothetical protein D6795_13365 [Deltaproteobacteria bacterium]|nr:MAG: hypothetical protein D6795_13365 [Deltaproteobacteria bacterium]
MTNIHPLPFFSNSLYNLPSFQHDPPYAAVHRESGAPSPFEAEGIGFRPSDHVSKAAEASGSAPLQGNLRPFISIST